MSEQKVGVDCVSKWSKESGAATENNISKVVINK